MNAMRPETTSEHVARDMREGRFPERSEPQMVADLAAIPAQVLDLIHRMDAIQACQVGPSDEWSKATKSGYEQAATDCQRNILRIKPAAIEPHPDPRDEVIKGLVEALSDLAIVADRAVELSLRHDDFKVHAMEPLCQATVSARAALAAAKEVQ